jgi:hypothetical protein
VTTGNDDDQRHPVISETHELPNDPEIYAAGSGGRTPGRRAATAAVAATPLAACRPRVERAPALPKLTHTQFIKQISDDVGTGGLAAPSCPLSSSSDSGSTTKQ